MRPDRSHWLLIPLFLLPFVVGAALAYLAHWDYRSRIARLPPESSIWIQRSLQEPRAISWRTVEQAQPAARLSGPFGGRLYLLDLPPGSGVPEEWSSWRLWSEYPEGPPAEALADPDRRIALELGSSDAPQPRATVFARLYRNPDLAALRDADLPAATKIYLLDRTREGFPGRDTVRTMLRLAVEYQNADEEFPVGLTRVAGGYVFRLAVPKWGRGPSSYTLIPDTATTPAAHQHVGDYWTITFGVEPAEDPIWSGEVDAPVRGTWSIAARYGPRWIDVPAFRKWIPLYLGISLAYLVLPVALWIAMRRRRQLDAARIRFLTEIAHDLRTPLTSVRLHAELLARGKTDRHEKYLGILERESVRASELLGNLLDLSRLERGARQFDLEPVDVADIAMVCAEEFRRLYPDRAGDLTAEGPRAAVRADRTALARCLRNLLDNAGKYTGPGTRIRLRWSDEAIRVEDEGDGVPDPDRLFRRYVRGSNTEGVSGTGLGLSLVRELIEGMGGTIRYRDGKPGAVFEIMLPGVDDA